MPTPPSLLNLLLLLLFAFPLFLTTALAAPQPSPNANPNPQPSPQLPGLNLIGELLGLIPILSTPPPTSLWTKNPSPECAAVNGGALYCCESTFNGDIPIVVELAPLVAYKLNPNSINCIYPSANTTTCNPGTILCCQVDALANTPLSSVLGLALYCQNAPSQD